MASYFNKTRGLVNVSLRTGESAVVGPKKTLHVTPEQDRSASLLSRVRKGMLIPLKSKESKIVPDPAPELVPAPVPSPPLPDESEEVPSMRWTKNRLIEYAGLLDLDVPSSSTKVEILKAIEEAE